MYKTTSLQECIHTDTDRLISTFVFNEKAYLNRKVASIKTEAY